MHPEKSAVMLVRWWNGDCDDGMGQEHVPMVATTEQAAWVPPPWPISTGTGAVFIAAVAVTTAQSAWLTSTEVGTEMVPRTMKGQFSGQSSVSAEGNSAGDREQRSRLKRR
jgi:hypothetical protein